MSRKVFSALRFIAVAGVGLICLFTAWADTRNGLLKYFDSFEITPKAKPAGLEINIRRNIIWCKVQGENLFLDVFWPKAQGIYPLVVNIHGGGWSLGSKEMDEALCRYLAERGYTVFNINYRLAPIHKFPAQVNDSLGAVIWAKEHAGKYQGDPFRAAVMGDSAGGNLSAMVAFAYDSPEFTPSYSSSRGFNASVQAAVLIYGVYDMTRFNSPRNKWVSFFYSYLGGPENMFPERYLKASPVAYLGQTKNYPSVLIIGGDKDSLYSHSLDFKNELAERGIKYSFYTARGGHHGFISVSYSKPARETFPVIGEFLDRELKGETEVKARQGISRNP